MLNLTQLQELKWAVDTVFGYETDNGCGDPECCGDPYCNREDYLEALEDLKKFGIEYDENA